MIIIRKAADTDIVRQIKNQNGGLIDLTTATFSCDLRETPTSNAIVSITPANLLATSGFYKIPIASSILTNLNNRTYYCKVGITIGSADYDDSFFIKIADNTGTSISAGHPKAGTTANRPTLTSGDAGFTYYDTTIGALIVWSGTAWDVSIAETNFRGSYTTAERLALDTSDYSIGDWVFDTEIKSPFWWNGSEWV